MGSFEASFGREKLPTIKPPAVRPVEDTYCVQSTVSTEENQNFSRGAVPLPRSGCYSGTKSPNDAKFPQRCHTGNYKRTHTVLDKQVSNGLEPAH